MSFLNDTLNDTVAKIEVRSVWGPTITIDRPFGPSTGATSAAGSFLKPEIVILDSDGREVVKRAPYGAPGASRWPFVALFTMIGLGTVAGMILRRFR